MLLCRVESSRARPQHPTGAPLCVENVSVDTEAGMPSHNRSGQHLSVPTAFLTESLAFVSAFTTRQKLRKCSKTTRSVVESCYPLIVMRYLLGLSIHSVIVIGYRAELEISVLLQLHFERCRRSRTRWIADGRDGMKSSKNNEKKTVGERKIRLPLDSFL